ncbi:hypothetical protein C0971_16085 [Bacillus methanolicus]|uniref:DUF2306 domain-containing protein n=1 Tax=Bacillus methanolicus TaxID=1471 RepID=UPI00200E9125|nr:DUF2306 domain-containing protein [Bacillus methanolicus]UQD53369.1 hypothetical protein C0971_16085 [Bacillus methanolicus]
MKKSIGSKIGIGLLSLFIIVFVIYAIVQYFIFGAQTSPYIKEKQEIVKGFQYYPWIYILYIHIFFGIFALILGPFQFSKKLHQKKKELHRNIGKIYVFSIFIASMVGLYLSFYGTGGIVSVIGFYTLDIAWIITTLIGFLKIRKKEIQSHNEWMLRSYAVTFTFVTFRIWGMFALMISHERGFLYGLTIIFSWVLNILIAQWIILRSKKRIDIYNEIKTTVR